MAEEDHDDLESLIKKSLTENPTFENATEASFGKTRQTPKKTLVERLLPLSAAFANAALSFPGNPAYTPAAVGAITYILANRALKLAVRDKNIKPQTLGVDTSDKIYNRILSFKHIYTLASGGAAFAISLAISLTDRQIELGTDLSDFYSGLLPLLPGLTPQISFAVINTLGAYVLFGGIERTLHSESIATLWHTIAYRVSKTRNQHKKAAQSLERIAGLPRSKEKEVAALLELGDAYLTAGEQTDAMNAYKRMLRAAARTDDLTGISDWLIRRRKRSSPLSNTTEGDTVYLRVQKAMRELVYGSSDAASSLLAGAVALEPKNRQLRRIRALFFEATGHQEPTDLEMRIYNELLKADPSLTYKAVGESRNEVLAPQDDTAKAPDIYNKRHRDKKSLDEEVANIAGFSQELPGFLPRIIEQGLKDGQHHITLESMGDVTMLQKAVSNNLTYSDVKAVIDLLVKVVAAGEKLRRQGAINVGEPLKPPTYTYSIAAEPAVAEELKREGTSPVWPNFENGFPLLFVHRVTDLYLARLEVSNGVRLSQEYIRNVQDGAAVLSSMFMHDSSIFVTYTDFTHRNILFDSVSGNLRGKIDWEQVRMLPIFFELVNILEFYKPNLGTVTHQGSLDHLIDRFEKETRLQVNRKVFKTEYEAAATLRHLELVGYRSRDTATSPENARAQVYHHLMARMHLVEARKHMRSEAMEITLKMLDSLEKEPIFTDERRQRELELEMRQSILPSTAYLLREISKRQYWRDFFGPSPKEMARILSQKGASGVWHDFWHQKPSPYKSTSYVLSFLPFFPGLPIMMASALSYVPVSYLLLQPIIPSMPPQW